jgi:hypothetical protein
MKIKGVTKGKNPGEVIELSASEKAPLALQDGLASHKDLKDKYLVYPRNIEISNLNYSSKGTLLRGKWQNNIYQVEGVAVLTYRNIAKDQLLEPRKKKFVLKFEDTTDNLGQPDLRVLALDLLDE